MKQIPISGFSISNADPEVEIIRQRLLELDPVGARIAGAIRRSFDMLLDGQHTGRYRWDQLFKTEKTHCGTLVEINLQREFNFNDGDVLDYKIHGIEVDCKFAQKISTWMIPPEATDKIILGLWANDQEGLWSAGLVRAKGAYLNPGGNRDSKRTLNTVGRNAIHWIFQNAPLPENILLHIPPDDIAAIFSNTSGQARVTELFRRVHKRPVSRTVIATLAEQEDYMARVRDNGRGARTILRDEGIVIFGDFTRHRDAAIQLGLPEPGPGEFISARLIKLTPHRENSPSLKLDGAIWVAAQDGDPVERAPRLPDVRKSKSAVSNKFIAPPSNLLVESHQMDFHQSDMEADSSFDTEKPNVN